VDVIAAQGRWSANLSIGYTQNAGAIQDFESSGGGSVAGGASFAANHHLAFGLRLGWHRAGSGMAPLGEEVSTTIGELSANACLRSPLKSLRLDACAGAGPYLYHHSPGSTVSNDDIFGGWNVAIVVDRPSALGSWGIGAEAAYHAIPNLGPANRLVILGLRLTLH